jgi:hypothetical protein
MSNAVVAGGRARAGTSGESAEVVLAEGERVLSSGRMVFPLAAGEPDLAGTVLVVAAGPGGGPPLGYLARSMGQGPGLDATRAARAGRAARGEGGRAQGQVAQENARSLDRGRPIADRRRLRRLAQAVDAGAPGGAVCVDSAGTRRPALPELAELAVGARVVGVAQAALHADAGVAHEALPALRREVAAVGLLRARPFDADRGRRALGGHVAGHAGDTRQSGDTHLAGAARASDTRHERNADAVRADPTEAAGERIDALRGPVGAEAA